MQRKEVLRAKFGFRAPKHFPAETRNPPSRPVAANIPILMYAPALRFVESEES